MGIAASGIIVTEMMLADVKGGTFDMRKKKTRDLIQFSALGIAMYRLFTGLSLGGVGSTVSGMFDGHLDAFYGRQGPLVNTPAQMSEFKQIVNTNQIPNPGMPGQSMTVHTVNPNRLSQLMNSPTTEVNQNVLRTQQHEPTKPPEHSQHGIHDERLQPPKRSTDAWWSFLGLFSNANGKLAQDEETL